MGECSVLFDSFQPLDCSSPCTSVRGIFKARILEWAAISFLHPFRPVAQSCPTLCDPIDCSTPGFPVLHHLLEFAQTHVHCVGDAIQPSHPLSPSSPPVLHLSSIRVFSNDLALCIRWPKYWSFSISISPSN